MALSSKILIINRFSFYVLRLWTNRWVLSRTSLRDISLTCYHVYRPTTHTHKHKRLLSVFCSHNSFVEWALCFPAQYDFTSVLLKRRVNQFLKSELSGFLVFSIFFIYVINIYKYVPLVICMAQALHCEIFVKKSLILVSEISFSSCYYYYLKFNCRINVFGLFNFILILL